MIGKRTGIDFSKHDLKITDQDGLLVHYLKKPGTSIDSIRYINTNGIMAVNGDYGNWIFCREFHPSENGHVSDHYWCEKLINSSTQNPYEFDGDATRKALEEKLKEYKEENGERAKEEVIEYYQECISTSGEHELDYTHFAYREYPRCMDTEDVIFEKSIKYWLKAVFDGFEEICRRMKQDAADKAADQETIAA